MYELRTLARGGVLLTVWALAAGRPHGTLLRRLRGEGWQRLCRGAWAVPGKEVDWRVRAAAVQLLRPELVCSHGTAAAVHRVELLAPGAQEGADLLEFTARRASSGRIVHGRIRVHGSGALTERDCATRRGLRVTTAVRTVGDLIRAAGGREAAVVVAESALSHRRVAGLRREPLVRAAELAAELAAPRRAGGPAARRWLPLAVPGSGSPAETVARLRLSDAGLHAEVQPTLRTRPAARCAPTCSSGPPISPSRSRASPSTAPAPPTSAMCAASTSCRAARRCGGCCASRRTRCSAARTG
ncbi:hypothetical protein [Streptomyces sp. NPDC090025]|uniref:hypothetical protein n=1 Tax=Streptomyces sp. NPDC090025 TaxID=3365922 RepID=UPI00383444FD